MIQYIAVASHRGAWIEILMYKFCFDIMKMSRPTGARGLKFSIKIIN